jgi:hypothetical protein
VIVDTREATWKIAAMSQPRPLLRSPWFLGALLLSVLFWTFDLAVLRAGVPHPLDDSWEDGIVARQLIQGRGFRTHMIYPPLWELRDPHNLTVPVLVHGPLVPLLLALPLKLTGPALLDHVAWIAAAFALLTLIPLFRLARRYFGEAVAAGAAGLFTFSPLTIAAVNHYLTVVVGAFLLAMVLDLLAREHPRPILAGILAGLCYLARPEMLAAAPVLALLAWNKGMPRAPWIFLLAFAAGASWWWWERWRAVGSPFFTLSSYLLILFSPAHPGDALVRDFNSPPSRFPQLFAEALPSLWRKWVHFFPRAVARALTTPSAATGWIAWIGAASALSHRELRRTMVCFLLLALIPVVSITLLASVRLYPVPFLPLFCIGAAFGAKRLLEWLPPWAHRPRAWLGILAMLALPSAGIELQEQTREARSIERWLRIDRSALAGVARTPENATRPMFSDTPDFVAWTTERPTVWLMRADFDRLFAPGAQSPLPARLPERPDSADTWFHVQDPRDPANQAGSRIAF